jgi:hypothetical protein
VPASSGDRLASGSVRFELDGEYAASAPGVVCDASTSRVAGAVPRRPLRDPQALAIAMTAVATQARGNPVFTVHAPVRALACGTPSICPGDLLNCNPTGNALLPGICGLCSNTPEDSDCGGGVCVDLISDVNNCGSCGNGCDAGATCCNGTCANLKIDINNCGGCGVLSRNLPVGECPAAADGLCCRGMKSLRYRIVGKIRSAGSRAAVW